MGNETCFSTIVQESVLEIRSEAFERITLTDNSDGLVVVPGIISNDTIAVYYWPNPTESIQNRLELYAEIPPSVPVQLGRYVPTAITHDRTRFYIAVENQILAFELRNQLHFISSFELPVVPTQLTARNDTLFFVSDRWNSHHNKLRLASQSGFYGMVTTKGSKQQIEYWSIPLSYGLVMNLFQPRNFMALRGPYTAWVDGRGDSLIVESKNRVIAKASLPLLAHSELSAVIQEIIEDNEWSHHPTSAMDRIRPLYKNADILRKVEFASDSTIVVTVSLAAKFSVGMLKGRNQIIRYLYKLVGGILELASTCSSCAPQVSDLPAKHAPLGQHTVSFGPYVVVVESLGLKFMDFTSYASLLGKLEESAQPGVYHTCVQLRSR